MDVLEDWLDERDVARKRKVSVRTVQEERYRGTGAPYVKIGRLIRYRPSDVAAYLARHLVVPGHESDGRERL
jgi:hypothetical protein